MIYAAIPSANINVGRGVTQLRKPIYGCITAKGVSMLFEPAIRIGAANHRHLASRYNTVRTLSSRQMNAIGKDANADKGQAANVKVDGEETELVATHNINLLLNHLDLNLHLLLNLLFNDLLNHYNVLFHLEFHLQRIRILGTTPVDVILGVHNDNFDHRVFTRLNMQKRKLNKDRDGALDYDHYEGGRGQTDAKSGHNGGKEDCDFNLREAVALRNTRWLMRSKEGGAPQDC